MGLVFAPFHVNAQEFALLADAIGQTITQSVKVISAVTEQLNQAVTNGLGIYDKIKLRELLSSLRDIERQMVSINAKKRNNIQEFRDYINHDPFAESWPDIQKDCAVISAKLNSLLSSIGDDDTVLVQGTSFATAGDLKAALSRQASIYLHLSTLKEPATEADRTQLTGILDKLELLLNNVITLESSIETYLQKFA